MKFERKKTRQIILGGVEVGGMSPITIQSMTTTKTHDVESTVSQIIALETAGCEIVRVAVLNEKDANAISQIKDRIRIPLVADIHFNYRLALTAIKNNVDGLRINPGNIGSKDRIKAVVEAAAKYDVPIRIGVNSGSLEKDLLEKYKTPTAHAMLESALRHIKILEEFSYTNLKVSLKASHPLLTIEANELFSENSDYPIHLGVTEAGPPVSGAIKSASALSLLIAKGIGDTIRISLTADPVLEIRAALVLLESLGLRKQGLRVVSCPTCGRCQASDMMGIAERVEKRLAHISKPLTVAVMGCAVNGPGEAREADIGIACSKGQAILFKKGQKIGFVDEDKVEDRLVKEALELVK